MRRNFILAWALCTTACFAEPPSSTSSSSGSTSAASTGTTADSDDDDDDDDTSTSDASVGGSTTTSGFGTASFGGSSSTGDDPVDTSDPPPGLLVDIYEDCAAGTWETDNLGLGPTNCDFSPGDAHTQGGGWRFPTYDSEEFGRVEKALVLRPGPETGGLTQASFNSDQLGFASPGSRVKLRYEFINTKSPTGAVGTMSFQIRRLPPNDGMMKGNNGVTLFEDLDADGGSGVVDVALNIAGPLDDLVFIVIGGDPANGQGVALYQPEIVFEP